MICFSNIVTDEVIVQSEHFLLVPVELDHRAALILVPLENTTDLNKTNVNIVNTLQIRRYASQKMIL